MNKHCHSFIYLLAGFSLKTNEQTKIFEQKLVVSRKFGLKSVKSGNMQYLKKITDSPSPQNCPYFYTLKIFCDLKPLRSVSLFSCHPTFILTPLVFSFPRLLISIEISHKESTVIWLRGMIT